MTYRRRRERRAHQPFVADRAQPGGFATQAAQQPIVEHAHVGSARPQPGHAGAVHRQPDEPAGRVSALRNIRTATSARTSPATTATAATTTSSSPTPWAIRRSIAASSRRTSSARSPEDEEIALHVVEETDEGVIVSGGKQLSTAAVFSNETYVSLSQTFYARNDPRFVLAFSIATNSPGLEDPGREPVGRWFGSWGHPFQMLDEQDCMLFFDRVLVPWDRVFFLYEAPARVMAAGGPSGAELNFAGWANLERALFRFRLLTAVATLVAEAIGVIEFREVASKLGEMVANCEMLRLAMDGIEHSSRATAGMPGQGPVAVWMAQTTWRMTELLREICGSGIVMQPSENDLANPELRPSLEQFMRGKDVDVEYKSRLFRVAHDLAMSSFGMRQDIYEYWHGGDPSRNRINLLRAYDQSDITERIKDLCSRPLPHGDVP